MTVLFLGTVAFLILVVAGSVWEWPFLVGPLLTLCFFLFVLVWAFDGMGRGVSAFLSEQPHE